MIQQWQLQEAKNKFSQVVDCALHQGPQLITRRGIEVAVLLSYAEYQQRVAPREKLSDFFQNSPLAEVEIDLERDKSPVREEFVL